MTLKQCDTVLITKSMSAMLDINMSHKLKLIDIGVAPITQLRSYVIKIVTFKDGHLTW